MYTKSFTHGVHLFGWECVIPSRCVPDLDTPTSTWNVYWLNRPEVTASTHVKMWFTLLEIIREFCFQDDKYGETTTNSRRLYKSLWINTRSTVCIFGQVQMSTVPHRTCQVFDSIPASAQAASRIFYSSKHIDVDRGTLVLQRTVIPEDGCEGYFFAFLFIDEKSDFESGVWGEKIKENLDWALECRR